MPCTLSQKHFWKNECLWMATVIFLEWKCASVNHLCLSIYAQNINTCWVIDFDTSYHERYHTRFMHSYGAMDYLNAYSYLFTWLQKACQGSMISADDEHLDILLVSNNVHCIINLALHNFKWTIEVYTNIKVYIKPCFL